VDPDAKPVVRLSGGDVDGDGIADTGKLHFGFAGCECGAPNGTHVGDCDQVIHVWTPWEQTDKLPTESGHYILMNGVTTTMIRSF
jgi:hypothetical protein